MEKEVSEKARVLYLDDDEINIVLFKANLDAWFDIIGMYNPKQAITYLKENEVDVILTDQIMPEMDGIEFLTAIEHIQSSVARILLTGVVNQEVMLNAINKVNIYRFHEKSENFDSLKLDIDHAFKMVKSIRQKNYYLKELQETTEKLQIISENVPAQILHTDLEGNILEINKDAEGIKMSDVGRNIANFLPEDEMKTFLKTMAKVSAEKKNHTIITRAFNFYENYQWYSTIIGPLHSKGEQNGFLMVGQDITDRINQEDRIMSAVLEAEDRQKSHIARDIHDGLQQTLTVALMNFESITELDKHLPESELQKYSRGVMQLEKGLQETRQIAYSLIPKAVEDFGFIETVDNLLEELNQSSETYFNFYTNLKKRISNQNIEYNLFRITQESLNNIIKYAKAKEVFVQLTEQDKVLQLTIEDDGIGFDTDAILNAKSSFGLFNMRKRAESLSGKIVIDSTVGRGTLIYIEIPLKD